MLPPGTGKIMLNSRVRSLSRVAKLVYNWYFWYQDDITDGNFE